MILLSLALITSTAFSSGGFDHGTSAGKGNLDFSLTLNPFNYFKYGQSYVIFGYGFTNRFDIHGYISHSGDNDYNYYGGFLYQFYKSKRLDLSSAIGFRKYINKTTTHLFAPQLLYTIYLTKKLKIGGSFVDVRIQDLKESLGIAMDTFFIYNIFEGKKYKVNFTVGAFNPVMWKPKKGEWYPTYSVDIKIKNFKIF